VLEGLAVLISLKIMMKAKKQTNKQMCRMTDT
jgi:hypothetical protein